MRFKLDENLPVSFKALFERQQHDVLTVQDEALSGCPDRDFYDVCLQERRCLVSLDLDFSDITRFHPAGSAGIVILRPPKNADLRIIGMLMESLLTLASKTSVEGHLWIVEMGHIRVHQTDKEE
jgi:predicted nuclease of predicted toxin-antitoxin system